MITPIRKLVSTCPSSGAEQRSADSFPADRAEDRIEKLCKPYTEQLKYPVSAISLQSGREFGGLMRSCRLLG